MKRDDGKDCVTTPIHVIGEYLSKKNDRCAEPKRPFESLAKLSIQRYAMNAISNLEPVSNRISGSAE
jgi:hypothetical protein